MTFPQFEDARLTEPMLLFICVQLSKETLSKTSVSPIVRFFVPASLRENSWPLLVTMEKFSKRSETEPRFSTVMFTVCAVPAVHEREQL